MENLNSYTVHLSDAQKKALEYVAYDIQDWIENAVYNRCSAAIDEIVQLEVERITLIGGTISGTKNDIVINAPVKSAKERDEEIRKQILEELKAEEDAKKAQLDQEEIARLEDQKAVEEAYRNL